MTRRSGLLRLLACVLGLLLAPSGRAATLFDKLVTPGPVATAHAKLETDCFNCHKPFAKAAQNDLCAACHKDISADIAAKRGFHSRNPEVARFGCKHCHAEHVGRDADITGLNRKTFDHNLTEFALTGGHIKVACDGCHKPAVKFRAAPSTCIGCHRKDDVHKTSLGEDCAACHGVDTWKNSSFDHDRDTKYPLTGRHAKVRCEGCHQGEPKIHPTPTECSVCHGGAKDPHKGSLGPLCAACHDTTNWKRIIFDHDQSAFPLIGKHAGVKCADCHKTPDFKATPIACAACHDDKAHQGRLGPDCASCHNAVSWKAVRFDHARDARYALEGAHAITRCESCHAERNPVSLRLPADCLSCHKAEDVHHGAFGADCGQCHNADNWKKAFIKR